MLTLFRRHLKTCPHTSRRERRCKCPISVEGTLGGNPIRKALDLTSWEAAESRVRDWIVSGKFERPKRTIVEAIAAFLSDCRARELRDGTIRLYEQTLAELLAPWCTRIGLTNVRDVTIEHLRDFRQTWTCSAMTSARRIDRMRTFFRFGVDSDWIANNPATRLRAPVVRPNLRMPFTAEEVQAIFDACDRLVTRGTYGRGNRHRVRAFIYILRYTGLRISDAIRLDESRVRDGRVFLRTEKTGTAVWVPIPQFVVEELSRVPRVGSFYFQTGFARPKTVRGGWDRTVRTVLKLAGVTHGSSHVFRHTLATDLLAKGVPVETVATILGHGPDVWPEVLRAVGSS